MITVSIFINGNPILTRSATRTKDRVNFSEYTLDTGNKIIHKPEDGAVALAKLMLDDINEKAMDGEK